MREPVLGIARGFAFFARELGVDLGVGHHDAVLDLALAQPRHHDLVADVVAEARVLDAVALERGAEVGHREAVLLRDALDGALEGGVVDLDAGFLGELHLEQVVDHALEDLARERVGGGKLPALALQLAHDERHALAELVLRDHLVVHDRDDAIDGHDLGWRRGKARVEALSAGDCRSGDSACIRLDKCGWIAAGTGSYCGESVDRIDR